MEKDFKSMTVEELDQFASENGIDLSEASTKPQKITAIEKHNAEQKGVEFEVMGVKGHIKANALDDMELIEWMDEVQCGNVMKFPKVCRRLFGDEWQKITAVLRNDVGVIPASKATEFYLLLIQELNAKNS